MKVSINSVLLPAFLLLCFSACQKEDAIAEEIQLVQEKTYTNVSPALWDYFQRFEVAALERGVEVDLNAATITADFEEIPQNGVAGTCTYGSHQPGHIVIDETFWSRASDLLKEMIVFHELGHCILFLDHREGTHRDGTCKSLMRSGIEDCRDNYQLSNRAEYLDELFGQE